MFVSIIVPSYNHAQFLEERIESILNQDFHNFEVILLDDLSSDNSAEILKKYQNHPKVSHCIINEKNSFNADNGLSAWFQCYLQCQQR